MVDVSVIPISAVERVEVWVINIIMKSTYTGAEMGASYGFSTNKGHWRLGVITVFRRHSGLDQKLRWPRIMVCCLGFNRHGRCSELTSISQWFPAARRSKLEPIKNVALALKNHLSGLLNYFLYPITNAMTEGFNSKIQAIKADARGFRRFENYRARILFHCGKLTMLLDLTAKPDH